MIERRPSNWKLGKQKATKLPTTNANREKALQRIWTQRDDAIADFFNLSFWKRYAICQGISP